MFFARRMLEIQAKAEYADVMELALYNGVLSGMALDGKSKEVDACGAEDTWEGGTAGGMSQG